jgi:hypothetical protein
LVDISVKQAQSHQVAKLLALQLLGRANLTWTVLKCCRFCLLFCRPVYFHWWRPAQFMEYAIWLPFIITGGELWCPGDVIYCNFFVV